MPRRRRTILLASLALVVPLPALALSGETGTVPAPAVADLGVSASLDSCGLLETQIVCQLSVSYATLPNATSYTASVTAPDGSVTDAGAVPAGGTSLTVPYVGNGSYNVTVTAYGVAEEPDGEEKVIATDSTRELSEPGSGEARISEAPVKSDTTPRFIPDSVEAGGRDPVATEATCVQEPAVPSEPEELSTPEDPATTTPADPTVEAETERTTTETALEQAADDPAATEAPVAPADCPAP